MKTHILTFAILLFSLTTQAQSVQDTVSLGATYADQVWYSLENDEQGRAPKTDWDIAFDLSPQGFSILMNPSTGLSVWRYPNADTTGWATVDTTGISTWPGMWNSDTSWSEGAFSRYLNPNDPFDVGWGLYSMFTHYVTGDSIYILELPNGDFKKLWLQQLANGVYTFRHADLGGTNQVDASLTKSSNPGKNFLYYSVSGNQFLDREPVANDWDLTFTQYTTYIPTAYLVTGVLSNRGVRVAEAVGIANPGTYTNYGAHSFQTAINTIGYDWKSFAGTWSIADSLAYFVETRTGQIWRIVFTGFGGSGNGNFIFDKELVAEVSTTDPRTDVIGAMTVYPNPSNASENATLVYSQNKAGQATLLVSDLSGRVLRNEALGQGMGLHTHALSTDGFAPGIYLVTIAANGARNTVKWVVR